MGTWQAWFRAAALLVLTAAGARAQVARIAHCEAAFAEAPDPLCRLTGCWITAGAQGVQAFTRKGKALPVPDLPRPGPGRRCTAVAVLPPGEGPCPAGAPHLVVAMAGDTGPARIVALGLDGTRWDWPTDGAGRPDGRNAVRDLALDRDGTIYAVFEDERDIVRIDLAGNRILHARIPEGAPDQPAGLLAMVRDPATGDLYVGDRFGIHQVTPAGAVLPLLAADDRIPPLTPCHLALHGRLLLIGDPDRGERFALHLDSRKLGSIRSAAGPLAVTPEGACLLAGPQGLRTLSLAALAAKAPGRAVPPERPQVPEPAPVPPWAKDIPPPARCATPGPNGRSARQLNLERDRNIRTSIRAYKRHLRQRAIQRETEERRLAGKREARARRKQARDQDAPPPTVPPRRRSPSVQGLIRLVLGGTALVNPPMLQAMAQGLAVMPVFVSQPDLAGQLSVSASGAMAPDSPLGSLCASPQVAVFGLLACDSGFQDGVLAQSQALLAQAPALLAPQSLSPGACIPGETATLAGTRIGLDQADQLARFDLFTAQATALCTQIERDAFTVLGVGFGLDGGAALATPFRSNTSLPLPAPALVLAETGAALVLAGFSTAGAGDQWCALGSQAAAAQAVYQYWAKGQIPALVAACAQAPGNGTLEDPGPLPGDASLPPAAPVPSPLPALADVLAKVELGCGRAAAQGLTLPICAASAAQNLAQWNTTLAGLYGQMNPSPATGTSGRELATAQLRQFAALANAAAMGIFAFGDGVFSAAEVLTMEGNAVVETGATLAADASMAVSNFLFGVANLVWANGYEMERIGALANVQVAVLTLAGNAESRAALDQQEAQDQPEAQDQQEARESSAPVSSSTAPAAPAVTGDQDTGATNPSTAAPAPAVPPSPGLPASGAGRLRPAWFLWLVP